MPGEPSGCHPRSGGVWTMFTGLLLFLFVFFVYLVGTARPDAARTELALASVRSTFGERPGAREAEGPFEAGASMLAELGGDLAASVRLAHVQRSGHGDDVTLIVPVAELFAPQDSQPRDLAVPLLDRTVAALSVPRAGLRLLLTVTFGTNEDGAENERAIQRAAALATTLLARGAPPDTLAVGLGPVESGRVGFCFRLAAPTRASGNAP